MRLLTIIMALLTWSILALVVWSLSPVAANPFQFDKRVPLKENPGLGDRGYGHIEYHHHFKHWHNQIGTHCCNVDSHHGDGDCRLTVAEYNASVGKWEALVDGQWRFIETDRHITNLSTIGQAVVCAGPYGTIYCFWPGLMSG